MKRTKGMVRTSVPKRTTTGDAQEFAGIDKWWEKRASYVAPTGPNSTKPVEPFAEPNDMWLAACEYFCWMESRPQYEIRPFHYQGHVNMKPIPRRRPFTQKGLLLFFDMSKYIWAQYKGTRGEGYATVVERIEDVIYQQKFEGATADLFNASIIARDLGLKEHSEITGANDGPIISRTEHAGAASINVATLTDVELDTIMKVIDASQITKREEEEQEEDGESK